MLPIAVIGGGGGCRDGQRNRAQVRLLDGWPSCLPPARVPPAQGPIPHKMLLLPAPSPCPRPEAQSRSRPPERAPPSAAKAPVCRPGPPGRPAPATPHPLSSVQARRPIARPPAAARRRPPRRLPRSPPAPMAQTPAGPRALASLSLPTPGMPRTRSTAWTEPSLASPAALAAAGLPSPSGHGGGKESHARPGPARPHALLMPAQRPARRTAGGRELNVVMSKQARKTPRDMAVRERIQGECAPPCRAAPPGCARCAVLCRRGGGCSAPLAPTCLALPTMGGAVHLWRRPAALSRPCCRRPSARPPRRP